MLDLCLKDRFVQFAPKTTTNVCLSSDVGDKSNYLLPVLSIKMQGQGRPMVRFNTLFDSASSRSYIDPHICKQLGLKLDCISDVE